MVMCGVAVVMMGIYDAGDALEGDRNSFITKYTLGNIGFVQTECVSQFIGINKHVKLQCQVGTMSQIVYTGLKPNKDGIVDQEGHVIGNDFCGDPREFKAEDDCSALVDITLLKGEFKDKCHLKKECEFNMNDFVFFADTTRPVCTHAFAYMYLQFKCEYTDPQDIRDH